MSSSDVREGPPVAPSAAIALTYASAALIARDRLPQLENGLLARTTAEVAVGQRVDVRIEARLEAMEIRAQGEVRWVTALATSRLVGLSLRGAAETDRRALDQVLHAAGPAGAVTAPAMTPAVPFGAASVLSVAMLQPNPVLREVLASALQKLTAGMGERWTLRLEATDRPAGFLSAISDRVRHLAVLDCDAAPGACDALVDAIRSHEVYRRLPIVLLSGARPAKLEDRFAVTMQKPLSVKSFLHTTGLLLRA